MMLNIMPNPIWLQVRAQLTEVTTEAAAKSNEMVRLQHQIQELQEQKKKVQDELKAASAASHSAAKVGRKLWSL